MPTSLIISCITIFCCRVLDVSLGTIKVMLTVKEKTKLAAIMGFFEVFLWYVVVKDAMTSDGPLLPIALSYAGGFAAGTYVGGRLARKLISGTVAVQVVTTRRDEAMLTAIRQAGYGMTVINANESEFSGAKYLILSSVDKRQLQNFEDLIKEWDEGAFISVQDTKSYEGGYFGK